MPRFYLSWALVLFIFCSGGAILRADETTLKYQKPKIVKVQAQPAVGARPQRQSSLVQPFKNSRERLNDLFRRVPHRRAATAKPAAPKTTPKIQKPEMKISRQEVEIQKPVEVPETRISDQALDRKLHAEKATQAALPSPTPETDLGEEVRQNFIEGVQKDERARIQDAVRDNQFAVRQGEKS